MKKFLVMLVAAMTVAFGAQSAQAADVVVPGHEVVTLEDVMDHFHSEVAESIKNQKCGRLDNFEYWTEQDYYTGESIVTMVIETREDVNHDGLAIERVFYKVSWLESSINCDEWIGNYYAPDMVHEYLTVDGVVISQQ